MFYRFYILPDRFDHGPCTSFENPIYKSEVFESSSLAEFYLNFSYFLIDFAVLMKPSEFLKPENVFVVYGDDPKVCPYRSSNKRQMLFGFNHRGKLYRTFGFLQL